MSREHLRTVAIIAAIAVGAALAGCSSAAPPALNAVDSAAPTPSATPNVLASPSAAPVAPTVDSVTLDDLSTVPATCDDLLDLQTVAKSIGMKPGEVALLKNDAEWRETMSLQAGERDCFWGNQASIDDFEYGDTMSVMILSDADADYNYIAGAWDFGSTALGSNSLLDCELSDEGHWCEAALLHSGYWIYVSVRGSQTAGVTVKSARKDTGALVAHITDALDGAGAARAPYQPPSEAQPVWKSCGQLDNGSGFRDALGVKKMRKGVATPRDSGAPSYEPSAVALARVEFADCEWNITGTSGIKHKQILSAYAVIVPGGEWAWPAYVEEAIATDAEAETEYDDEDTRPETDFAGAEAGLIVCQQYYGDDEDDEGDTIDCTAFALVGGSFLQLETSSDFKKADDARDATIAGMNYLISRL
jgi:hypothetical protein